MYLEHQEIIQASVYNHQRLWKYRELCWSRNSLYTNRQKIRISFFWKSEILKFRNTYKHELVWLI